MECFVFGLHIIHLVNLDVTLSKRRSKWTHKTIIHVVKPKNKALQIYIYLYIWKVCICIANIRLNCKRFWRGPKHIQHRNNDHRSIFNKKIFSAYQSFLSVGKLQYNKAPVQQLNRAVWIYIHGSRDVRRNLSLTFRNVFVICDKESHRATRIFHIGQKKGAKIRPPVIPFVLKAFRI